MPKLAIYNCTIGSFGNFEISEVNSPSLGVCIVLYEENVSLQPLFVIGLRLFENVHGSKFLISMSATNLVSDDL